MSVKSTSLEIKKLYGYEPVVVELSASGWKGCLRNVPERNFPSGFILSDPLDNGQPNGHIVTVRRNLNRTERKKWYSCTSTGTVWFTIPGKYRNNSTKCSSSKRF